MCLWGRIMTLYSRNVQIYYSLEHDIKRSQCRDCFLYGWGDEETWQIPAYILVPIRITWYLYWHEYIITPKTHTGAHAKQSNNHGVPHCR